VLRLVEGKIEKIAAVKKLQSLLRAEWRKRENRLVVWRPYSAELDISHNGSCWFYSGAPDRTQKTKRYWNSFGIYAPKGGLPITVEINIPTNSNPLNVSGFFAVDADTGTTYLMHDGGVGGGRAGISRSNFLAWSSERLVPVRDITGATRPGIIVTPLTKGKVGLHTARFVRKVGAFKEAIKVDSGRGCGAQLKESKKLFERYLREFSGKKGGRRGSEFEYISRHGDIVDALRGWRTRNTTSNERVVNNPLMDLVVVTQSGRLKELYEVKTSSDRQTLYTAIGQITVHASDHDVRRFVVIPNAEFLPRDISRALHKQHIKVLRFSMSGNSVRIHS
jgi:hypothetical protein